MQVPLLKVYTTDTVPGVNPVTTPPAVILAVPVPFAIDQVPPAVASVKAGVSVLTQTAVAPSPIVATTGNALMVNEVVAVFVHVPLLKVYTTVTVPGVNPVTTPPAVILAVPVPFVIDQVPPAVASVKAGVIALEHTVVAPPLIAATTGNEFTVNEVVAVFVQVPLFKVYTTVTVPEVNPVTTPAAVILAVPVPFVIDQVPPAVASVKAGVFVLTQTVVAPPPIAATTGNAFTVNEVVAVFVQVPLLKVYITVTVPGVNPVTTPAAVIVAVPVPFVIDQVPPAVASVKAGVFALAHTVVAPPPIAATTGNAFTVNEVVAVFVQVPLLKVYTTVTVPGVNPVTTPPAVMLAVPVPFVIDQVPPAVASVKAGVFALTHTVVAPPPIAATTGNAFTVNDFVAVFVQVPLLKVYTTDTVPGVNPVTTPPAVILAVPVPFVIDQVPPAVASVKAGVFVLTHTVVAPPPIDATTGNAFIVNNFVTMVMQVPLLKVYTSVTVPGVNPVTTPPAVTLAVPVTFVIDQVPPAVTSVKAGVFALAHTAVAPPPIAATTGNTFNDFVAMLVQVPLLKVYTTVTVPEVNPVTTPAAVTLADPVLFVIDQVPPAVASVKAGVLVLTHTDVAPPPIAATTGNAFIVNDFVALFVQVPLLIVYTTVAVPGVNPVTTPPAVILAVPVPFVIDQVPPAVASVKAGEFALAHTVNDPPAIADTTGNGFTVTLTVCVASMSPSPARYILHVII